MKPSKTQRQSRILKIVREQSIETQSELVEALLATGMTFTQATVSRDIKELGIVKVATGDGKSKYVAMKHSGEVAAGRLMNVFSEAVISINTAGAFVILKTLPGTAQAAASALDSMHIDDILGTLAGDDTIFIATDSVDIADFLRLKLIGLSTGDLHPDRRYS
ncbi:MAG: arginine repressor [Clostridiaceae bacterium]|jgi:transcriptional regulator of arginine metabolism|nr:arginine repressor [Clostridiaceae bacterium]NLW54902.1 arginine repressor [Clostridiaceae bacterium]HZJ91392.1 arginine repressor [Oscillospiraceae bacterium]